MEASDQVSGAARLLQSPGFAWIDREWGPVLQCTAMAVVAGNHGFTTRQLALQGPDSTCRTQWTQLAHGAGVHVDDLVRLTQVHGDAVSLVDGRATAGTERRADAALTMRGDVLLTVRVADCVPILLADPGSGAVAAVHAGWRGTAAAIAAKTVGELTRHFAAQPSRLVAAIGPSVGPCCYVVGSELVVAFRAAGHPGEHRARWFQTREDLRLDLWRANRDQLVSAGLRPEAVHVARLCTACSPDLFYSYRREGARAGRLVGFIRAPRRP